MAPPAPIFSQLGDYHRKIDTDSPLAQQYFDQGMVLFYSFELAEAVRSMRAATQISPDCAMCHFGLALSLKFKANTKKEAHDARDAFNAIVKASSLNHQHHTAQSELIHALTLRFEPSPAHQKNKHGAELSCHGGESDEKTYQAQYSTALRKLHHDFPNDQDIAALFALSLFDLHDWDFWTLRGQPKQATHELLSVLRTAVKQNPAHPGAQHYLLHALEPSAHPEAALPQAMILTSLVPNSEHMTHMPAHIFFRLGRYEEAGNANVEALNRYQRFTAEALQQHFEPTVTYLYQHNLHFLWSARSAEGKKDKAEKAALILKQSIPDDLLRQEPYMQQHLAVWYFHNVRFGEWGALATLPKPDSRDRYLTAMWHYAKGMYTAHTKNIIDAKKHLHALKKFSLEERHEQNLGAIGLSQMAIAYDVLAAKIALSERKVDKHIALLKSAVKKQDKLKYKEPPLWYFPVRQDLGAALLHAGYPKEAIKVFQADLKRNPNNVWSVRGLKECQLLLK